MYKVTRYHDICAGHTVYGHESKCAHLHGHNYRIYFTVTTEAGIGKWLDDIGRVVDFSVIKSKLCEWLEENWDHKFLVWINDPRNMAIREIDPAGTVLVPFNPTAENMAQHLVMHIGPMLLAPMGLKLIECTVQETRKCSATYTCPTP